MSEADLECSQKSMVECFCDNFQLLTIFAKKIHQQILNWVLNSPKEIYLRRIQNLVKYIVQHFCKKKLMTCYFCKKTLERERAKKLQLVALDKWTSYTVTIAWNWLERTQHWSSYTGCCINRFDCTLFMRQVKTLTLVIIQHWKIVYLEQLV